MRMVRDTCGEYDPKTQTFEVRTIPGPMDARPRFRIDEMGHSVRAGWSMRFACHGCLADNEVAWETLIDRHHPEGPALLALAEAARREVERIRWDATIRVRELEELLYPSMSTWERACEPNRRTHGRPGYVPPRWGRPWS